MRGAPAWHRRRSVQHPSTVLALRANPPSPPREKEKRVRPPLTSPLKMPATGRRRPENCRLSATAA
ncbi:MAG: hypothetical protein EOR03_25060 [Mesorhizobium sp.]|nr:MAG: hypothetical protein EOR03_25060 [Mesorhizobium sp.]